MSETSGLDEYIESIRKKIKRLQDIKSVLSSSAQTEIDPFKRATNKTLAIFRRNGRPL